MSTLDLQNTGVDELVDCIAMPGTSDRAICIFKQVVHILDGKIDSFSFNNNFYRMLKM